MYGDSREGTFGETPSPYRHLTKEETSAHFAMHFKRGIEELNADGLIPHPAGISEYVVAAVVGDCFRRSIAAQVPWNVILPQVVTDAYNLGLKLQGDSDVQPTDEGTESESDD